MGITAKQTYELVEKATLSYGYDATYMSGNQITRSTGTETYLLKPAMLKIVELTGGLNTNEMNFLNQCFKTMSMNTCNGTDQIVIPTELITMSEVNMVFCMKFGTDYVTEMTENFKG